MSRVVEKVISRGAEPFEFALEAAGTDETTFSLDDDSYQGEDGYFEGKTLYITGLRLVSKTGATIEYLMIDGQIVIHQDSYEGGLAADDDVIIDGSADNPKMDDKFMGPIPARINIGVKSSAGDGADLYMQGWMLDQDSEIAEAE